MTIHELIGMQYVPLEYIEDLKKIAGRNKDYRAIIVDAFLYGVIQGKRQERARRNK